MIKTQVCIVGAGPAGLTAAMNLNKLGVDCVLLDKEKFPRDKVCGDSFNGQVTHVLNRIDPSYLKEMEEQGIALKSWDYTITDDRNRKLSMSYNKAATARLLAKRFDFDAFLVNKAKQMPHVKVIEEVDVVSVKQVEDGSILTSRDGKTVIKAEMIIGASGETSKFYNELTQKQDRDGDTYLFTRGYFKNTVPLDDHEMIVHVFYDPMVVCYTSVISGGLVTVEVAIKQSIVKEYQINLREKLFEIIETSEPFRDRFKNAELVGKLSGTNIQLSFKKPLRSGHRFLLAGSAIQSMHPLIGYGVGHAMGAGEVAAQVASQALKDRAFTAQYLKRYDKLLQKKVGSEILLNRIFTFIFDHPRWLLPFMFFIGNVFHSLFTQRTFSKQFLNPSFYIKWLLRTSS
jgi:flavin-dependent dehydrogenase